MCSRGADSVCAVEAEAAAHLAAFYAAASRAGAYEAQADAGDAVHLALEALAASDAPRAIEALEALVLELDRLLINISCRINIRKPEILRPLRTRLSGLRRRVTLTLKAHGISSNRAKSTSPRRIASSGALCPLLDEIGPRHLCVFGCFFREYEPSRMLRAFLSAASDAGHRRVQLAGWRVEVRRTATEDKNDEMARKRRREERPAEDEPWLVDPAGGVHRTIKDALAALDADAPRGVEARGAVVSRFFGNARHGAQGSHESQWGKRVFCCRRGSHESQWGKRVFCCRRGSHESQWGKRAFCCRRGSISSPRVRGPWGKRVFFYSARRIALFCTMQHER